MNRFLTSGGYFRKGKHKGKHIRDVEIDYLLWMHDLGDIDDTDWGDVDEELDRRRGRTSSYGSRSGSTGAGTGSGSSRGESAGNAGSSSGSSTLPRLTVPADITRDHLIAVVSAGRKHLAARFHPDKPGGDVEKMKLYNNAADALDAHVRGLVLVPKR